MNSHPRYGLVHWYVSVTKHTPVLETIHLQLLFQADTPAQHCTIYGKTRG